jgi:CspA family cold shock protein
VVSPSLGFSVGAEAERRDGGTACGGQSNVANGTIKRLVRDRGFGFIRDEGGQEWFFHRSSVAGNFEQLNEGQRVSFDEEPSQKGPRAGNIRANEA